MGNENGHVKLLCLGNGKIKKTLNLSINGRIRGLALNEDGMTLKLIIWHQNGIHLKIYSIVKKYFKNKFFKKKKEDACKINKKNQFPK